MWARRGCGVRNRRGTVEEHGEQCCGTAGATVPGEADPHPMWPLLSACIASHCSGACMCPCHLSLVTTRSAPPARYTDESWTSMHAGFAHEQCSVQARHSRSCYDRSRATVAQRISTCCLVSKGHCTLRIRTCHVHIWDIIVPYLRMCYMVHRILSSRRIERRLASVITSSWDWWSYQ